MFAIISIDAYYWINQLNSWKYKKKEKHCVWWVDLKQNNEKNGWIQSKIFYLKLNRYIVQTFLLFTENRQTDWLTYSSGLIGFIGINKYLFNFFLLTLAENNLTL